MKDDRLISLNAAKDYIDSQKGRPFIGCTVGEAMKIMLDEVPSAQPGWIPVTERLPEKDGQYYVTQLRYGVYDSKMTGAYVRETNRIWYSVRHKRWSVMANCRVVAWIEELPKPWEGAEDAGET